MVQWLEIHTHPMTVLQRLSVSVLAALIPLSVIAQEVPNVTGIRASASADGKVAVQWNPVEGNIQKYRVFYSHASILEQGGVYDDYEDADGTATEHTLTNVPPVPTLYVSVLAVGDNGVESPFFVEEATVDLGTPSGSQPTDSATSSVAPLPPSPTVAMDSSTLQLLTAVSTSSTGVILAFTHPLSIPEQYKNTAFAIKSGSGVPLQVVRYRLDGPFAILDTGTQVPGRVYQITIHGSIAGKTPSGDLVPQEAGTAPLLFTGLRTDLLVPDVQNLALSAKGRDVEVAWTLPAATIRELQILQSTNGGRTYGTIARLEKTTKGVVIPGVSAGQLTVQVRVVGPDGAVSKGVQQTVSLNGSIASSSKPTTGTASSASSKPKPKPTTPGTKPGTLPSSGLGLATIVLLSGSATGVRFIRRKNAAKA